MSKKHQIVLPSLTKSTKEKLAFFPLTTKLDKHNIELLKEHGYKVNHGIQEVIYKLLPHRIFKPYLLYAFIFLQDLIKGRIVNSERYPYFLLFLNPQDYQSDVANTKATPISMNLICISG